MYEPKNKKKEWEVSEKDENQIRKLENQRILTIKLKIKKKKKKAK